MYFTTSEMCVFLFLQHSERLISKNYFNFMSYKYKHFFFIFLCILRLRALWTIKNKKTKQKESATRIKANFRVEVKISRILSHISTNTVSEILKFEKFKFCFYSQTKMLNFLFFYSWLWKTSGKACRKHAKVNRRTSVLMDTFIKWYFCSTIDKFEVYCWQFLLTFL